MTREEIIVGIKAEIAHLEGRVSEWSAQLKENAVQAFVWSEEAMRAAARIEARKWMLTVLEINRAESFDEIVEALTRDVLTRMKDGCTATTSSAVGNVMQRYRGEAWVGLHYDVTSGMGDLNRHLRAIYPAKKA